MQFSEMIYVRPDIEGAKVAIAAHTQALAEAADPEQARAAFLAMQGVEESIATAEALSYIRHSVDTRDEFYDGEVRFLAQQLPLLREVQQQWTRALLASPHRPGLEGEYGSLMFEDLALSLKTFSPEIVPQLQEENQLTIEYDNLIASAQIPFEGGMYTLSQLTPLKQDPDDARRRGAWEAEGGFYQSKEAELDMLYDKLVAVRTAQARKMGYENFIELGYYRMGRNCYDQADVALFRQAVTEHLVPVAAEVIRRQAERLGKSYPLSFADEALFYRSGNARPQGTPQEILDTGRDFYRALSPETAEFFDFMLEGELLDVLSRTGKAAGGYCIEIPGYRSPYIFANFNGTQGDVEVITHEAGHAFAAYLARDIVPMENRSPTMEACEVHSMSMEFFAWPWAEDFFGPDADKFRYAHLSNALTFIPYGTMVDHFQHEVYAHPELTPEGRHDVWRRLLGIYMPWLKGDGLPFYGEGKGWQRQAHIYENPFYYIDYCLAQTGALQFWALMQGDREDAWRRYLAFVKEAGRKTFTQLLASAGLDTPFGDAGLRLIAQTALQWLSQVDAAALK